MITRNQSTMPATTHGFLLSVEISKGAAISPEQIAMRLADSLAFVEGIGHVDVKSLGACVNCGCQELERQQVEADTGYKY